MSFSEYVAGGGEGQDRSSLFKPKKGDGKGFLDNFKEGALGYFKEAQKGKSDTDKLLDFC